MIDLLTIKDTLDSLFAISRIPMSLATRDNQVLYCNLKNELSNLPMNFMEEEIELLYKRNKYSTTPFMHATIYEIFIGGIVLDETHAIIVGPSSATPISKDSFSSKYGKTLSRENLAHLFRVQSQSSIADGPRFAHMLSLLSKIFLSADISSLNILRENFPKEPIESSEFFDSNDLVISSPSEVVVFQNSIVSAIQSGNRAALDEIWNAPTPLTLQTDSRSEVKDQRIYIPHLSSMNNAAINGGANYAACFSLFDHCTESLSSCITSSECNMLLIQASFAFCELVRTQSGAAHRPFICQELEEYINRHIQEHISTASVSAAFNMSERQISRIFQQHFQMPMMTYINKERLRRSCILLQNSDMTVSEISRYVGYVSQSYFTQLFNKEYGCSPLAYRKKPLNAPKIK